MTGSDTFAFTLVYCTTLGISFLMFLLLALAALIVLALAGTAGVLYGMFRSAVAVAAHHGPPREPQPGNDRPAA
ncbi:hypothetical protein HAV21_17100 [Paenarthrobacter sp. MSM-2-10-13]|uniref:hypothetical protein n=1 Tax=Paenarthrobacter sp. MSM-2-10-13 TaxID=2717318 RepID=UPI00142399E6|nr:hypothetical protein [Paenarthrobacter sp. MSM-2-10-13]NHW48592.1 hypothetical protein [Paenarthrobacter sp. MSM-2-10-13]